MEYIHIGKIIATHGIKGDVILRHGLGKKTNLKGIDTLFVEETKGSYIPYFIEKATAKNKQEIFITLEDVHSKESAQRFVKKNIWAKHEDFSQIVEASAPIALIGYLVYNEEEPLSEVLEVIEQPHQVLLRIEYQNKEVLIPVHEETLDEIDREQQKIFVTLPDGLLDIYLEH